MLILVKRMSKSEKFIFEKVLENHTIDELYIVRYNVIDSMLEVLETTYDENDRTISAEIEQLWVYIVVNINTLYDSRGLFEEEK